MWSVENRDLVCVIAKKKIAKKKLSHQTSVYCDYVYEKRVVTAAVAVVAGTRSWINFPLFAVFIRSSCARVYLTYWRQSAPAADVPAVSTR